eukprot:1996424-Pleurochrysis_carterae.AAC.1
MCRRRRARVRHECLSDPPKRMGESLCAGWGGDSSTRYCLAVLDTISWRGRWHERARTSSADTLNCSDRSAVAAPGVPAAQLDPDWPSWGPAPQHGDEAPDWLH